MVSLSDLPDLGSVQAVEVAQNAVVTPSVLDELKSNRIELRRTTNRSSTGNGEGRPLIVALDLAENETLEWKKALASHPTTQLSGQSIGPLMVGLKDAVQCPKTKALLVTPRLAFAVCELNRYAHVRAAHEHHHDSLRLACEDLNPNILVLHPRHLARVEQLLPVYSSSCDSGKSAKRSLVTMSHSLRRDV